MQQFSQKYTVVQFFEAVPESTVFSSDNWPLHSTIIDTFAVDWGSGELKIKLAEFLVDVPLARSNAEGDIYFGGEDRVRVTLLEKTDSLTALHSSVVALLESGGLELNDPQFAREGFLPHATVQAHSRLHRGDAILFNSLSIIDMFPNDDPYQRRVIATMPTMR